MKSNRSQLTLRLNESLDDKLSKLSKEMGISKNAYILMVLNNAV